MTIDQLIKRGSLEKRDSSAEELAYLLQIVDRDIRDSKSSEVSYDWQFGIAYNAALKLATILVRWSGYRVKGQGHHMTTFSMIPLILGPTSKDDAIYLDACRRKRNLVEYESINGATKEDVEELRQFILEFYEIVLKRVKF